MLEVVIGFGVLVGLLLLMYCTGRLVMRYFPEVWFSDSDELVDFLMVGLLYLGIPVLLMFLAYGLGGAILGTVK